MKEEDILSLSQSSGEKNEPSVTVKLMGNLGKLPDGKKLGHEKVKAPTTVRALLDELQKSTGLELRRDSTLVLVNGVEANALQDLDTPIESGDEVALIPMFHGGVG